MHRQEVGEQLLLAGVLQAQPLDGPNHFHLEHVGDIVHERGNLLDQALHVGFVAGLQQGGEGQGGNVAVGVCEQGLHVRVAPGNHQRAVLSQLVESADSSEAHNRLRGSQEDLKDGDGMHGVKAEDTGTLPGGIYGGQLAERSGGLVCHHLRPVAKARIQVGHQRLLDSWVPVRHQSLCSISHQQALSHRALHLTLGKLDHHLVEAQAVRLLQLVQQGQGVELHHGMLRASRLLDLVHPPPYHFRGHLHQSDARQDGRPTDERILVHDSGFQEPLYLVHHGAVDNSGENPDGVRTVAINVGMHVLGQ
mmetsp:Transcript_7569/g.17877  ORF Transcript_7569/g.17877 Transcript_7569/m.17877 type:complete len:307 (-) Transcript_7569:430-1350(-)